MASRLEESRHEDIVWCVRESSLKKTRQRANYCRVFCRSSAFPRRREALRWYLTAKWEEVELQPAWSSPLSFIFGESDPQVTSSNSTATIPYHRNLWLDHFVDDNASLAEMKKRWTFVAGIPRTSSTGLVHELADETMDEVPDSEEACRRGEYTVIRSLIRVLEVSWFCWMAYLW